MSDTPGAPLRALLLAPSTGPFAEMAGRALDDLGVEQLATVEVEQLSALAAIHARLRPADMLVLVLHEAPPSLEGLAAVRDVRPLFLCTSTSFDRTDAASRLLRHLAQGQARLVGHTRYEGADDLRWKLGQAIAGFLSARFRLARRQQDGLLGNNNGEQRQAIVGLATHRDARQRQVAARLALHYAGLRPEQAPDLIRQLVATGRIGAFHTAAQLLHELARRDGAAAARLLDELNHQSSAFRGWIFARLGG